jgi:hypothetical protein
MCVGMLGVGGEAHLRGLQLDCRRIDDVFFSQLRQQVVEPFVEILRPQFIRHPRVAVARDDDQFLFHGVLQTVAEGVNTFDDSIAGTGR